MGSIGNSIAGRRVLIAGASKGLGRAAALRLASEGARLALGARDGAALAALARETGGQPFFAPVDLTDAAQTADFVSRADAALGGIDVLIVTVTAGRSESSEADLAASFAVDLAAPLRLFAACRPFLAASRGAAVFCSSRSAQTPFPRTMAYGSAKAALEYATRCLAAETLRDGIRVNAIAPGSTRFEGGFWERCETADPELWRRTRHALPAGRLGTADDILPPLLFLCSDAARWITGQTLLVDGGQTLAPFIPPLSPEA